MLLLDSDGTAAQQVAGRVLKGIAADQEEPRMTVAIGIGAYPSDGGTIESLLEAADRALYQMKRSRGGAVTAEPLS
jgi:GGDEF domain-containing protein